MKISVIIPAYERVIEVLVCLNSLQALETDRWNNEYIVSDDASPSVFMPAVISGRIATIGRNVTNAGFGANCNEAARHAQGDILFFVNQDIVALAQDAEGNPLAQAWDKTLRDAFENPEIGIVGARLLFEDGSLQSAGGEFDGRRQPHHRYLGAKNIYWDTINTPKEVSWITGAALAVRRDLFTKLNGFDEQYVRGYFEDVDLCLRAREAGFKVWYEPRITFTHTVGTSGSTGFLKQNAQLFFNRWVQTKKIEPETPAVYERFW